MVGPRKDWGFRMGSETKRRLRLAACVAALAVASAVHAQSPAPGAGSGQGRDRMLIEARELVYNNDRNTVEAVGDVQIFYQAERSRPTVSSITVATSASSPRAMRG